MAKKEITNEAKKIDEIEEPTEIISEEEIITEEKIEETPQKDLKFGKNPLRVYRIEGEELVLEDSAGNGIRIPLPEQYRESKPGDIIYI